MSAPFEYRLLPARIGYCALVDHDWPHTRRRSTALEQLMSVEVERYAKRPQKNRRSVEGSNVRTSWRIRVEGSSRADESEDHLGTALRDAGEDVAQEEDSAAPPSSAQEYRGD